MLFLPLGETDFQLDPPRLIVHVERHQRIAGALRFPDEPFDFIRVQQQLAGTDRIRLDMGGGGQQRADMTTDKKQLGFTDDDIRFFQLNAACTDRLNLPTFEDQACLISFLDKIIMKGFFILDDTHAGEEKR